MAKAERADGLRETACASPASTHSIAARVVQSAQRAGTRWPGSLCPEICSRTANLERSGVRLCAKILERNKGAKIYPMPIRVPELVESMPIEILADQILKTQSKISL